MPKKSGAPKKDQKKRITSTIRENCEASVKLQTNANGKWIIDYVSFLEIESESRSNICCTKRDIRNILQKEINEMKDYNTQLLIEHFGEEKEINYSFFLTHKVDNDNKLTHVLWADGLAQKSYHQFGNVLILDMTYDTNEYSLVFSPFTRTNHHGQSVDFGAGFMNEEKIPSILWLFEKWKEAMGGPLQKLIITDQDLAME